MDINPKFVTVRPKKRKRFYYERIDKILGTSSKQILIADDVFKIHVFYALMDSVISNLTTRSEAAKSLYSTSDFLWNYFNLIDEQVEVTCNAFVNEYTDDVTSELCHEVKHLKSIHSVNLVLQDANEQWARTLKSLDFLNKLCELNLRIWFPNCCVTLRMFCTLSVTVA